MNTNSEPFTVTFGKIARTLEYRDSFGSITFTFDAGQTERALVLEHHNRRLPRQINYSDAFARAKAYLQSCGYQVEDYGDDRVHEPLPIHEAIALIGTHVICPFPPGTTAVDPPVRGTFNDVTSGTLWPLWVVALVSTVGREGFKVVFDEVTAKFGVTTPSDVFLGLWGDLPQTLAALRTEEENF